VELTAVGERLYFVVREGPGSELWRSDGTATGTHLVRSFRADVLKLRNVGGALWFFTDDALALWTSAGSEGDTRRVTLIDLAQPLWPSPPSPVITVGDRLFFGTDDHDHGPGLWVSDGTAAGTHRVPGMDSDVALIVPVGERVFVAGEQGGLWWTDRAGTTATKVIDRRDVITAGVGFHGRFAFRMHRLWLTDGNPGDAVLVRGAYELLGDIAAMRGRLYFPAWGRNAAGGAELWTSDGTKEGTHRVKDINRHGRQEASSSYPGGFLTLDGVLYFRATARTRGFDAVDMELYRSDGTAAGTWRMTDIDPEGNATPRDLTALGHTILFTADDGRHGRELWRVRP
jgi:ELWxxDGT repeat protein